MRILISHRLSFIGLIFLLINMHSTAFASPIAHIPDRLNLEVVGHSDLEGAGKGGEGLALKENTRL